MTVALTVVCQGLTARWVADLLGLRSVQTSVEEKSSDEDVKLNAVNTLV